MDQADADRAARRPPRWWALFVLFGLYLTAHGYHSRDNDQAYRLPLLIDRQDPSVFADDPFVRAFDRFNPHAGYLALLDATSRLVGLSGALLLLYLLTFALTAHGLDRLARATWPEADPRVGVAAVGLVLAAKAGNLGTNHLFEPLLLERLLVQGIGWVLLARLVERPVRGLLWVPGGLAVACWIHPSLGLQVGLLILGTWVFWTIGKNKGGIPAWSLVPVGFAVGLGVSPSLALMADQSRRLLDGLPAEDLRLLSAYVQSPQHMIPHLWRRPQWLAWVCYPVLAGLALGRRPIGPAGRRLALLLAANLLGLGVALVAIEGVGDLRVILFQPFRLATVARGLCLVLISGHWLDLWRRGGVAGKVRAALLVVGLTGDWSLVAVSAAEVATVAAEWWNEARSPGPTRLRPWAAGLIVLGLFIFYLYQHDTESGHRRLLLTLAVVAPAAIVARGRGFVWKTRRVVLASALAWAVPVGAMVAPRLPWRGRLTEAMVARCRFGESPINDFERLALWCRGHTPEGSRFIGPPGPKTFRLWALRPLAFNRAGSPYHAEGLADWAARFRDHVGFRGTTAEFARAYLDDRQGLEARYDALSEAGLAELARRQGASHVLARRPARPPSPDGPLELLRVEGRYAVYRLRADEAQARAGTASAGTG